MRLIGSHVHLEYHHPQKALKLADRHLLMFFEDRAYLGALGFVIYREIVYPGFTRDWGAFCRALRDFAQMLFRP